MKWRVKQIKQLEKKYGSPLYVFNKNEFVNNYTTFEQAFKKRYDKYKLSYSYKTNYTPYICKIVKQLGGYAEVVSDMEYSIARQIGYDCNKIIYNGPYKGNLCYEHLLMGGILNVDNLEEFGRIVDFANSHPDKTFNIGLRLNIDVGQSFVSRFGIDTSGKELQLIFSKVKELSNLHIVGLHCHIGQSRSVAAWKKRTLTMLSLADSYFPSSPPQYIDLGSGMYGRMQPILASQFANNIPTYDDYAEVTAGLFQKHYKDVHHDNKPILFTEPGTTLINSYIDFIGKITAVKEIKSRVFIMMNCSKDNIGDICKMKRLPIQHIPCGIPSICCQDASITGYTCLEHDVMYPDFSGSISIGDYIVFNNVGGYSNVSKPPFISQNCAMISLSDTGTEIMKHAETVADILHTYVI